MLDRRALGGLLVLGLVAAGVVGLALRAGEFPVTPAPAPAGVATPTSDDGATGVAAPTSAGTGYVFTDAVTTDFLWFATPQPTKPPTTWDRPMIYYTGVIDYTGSPTTEAR